MEYVEIVFGILLVILCGVTTYTDIKEGIIYNKTLLVFAGLAVLMDGIYYGIFARNLLILFLINFVITGFVGIILFYCHSFAGGDAKLLLVLALLFPAGWYWSLNGSPITLVIALGIAIFYGYLYLLVSASWALIKGSGKMTGEYVKSSIVSFLKQFGIAVIYLGLANLLLLLIQKYVWGIPYWSSQIVCIILAFSIGRIKILRNKYMILAALLMDALISFGLKVVPISLNPADYVTVLFLFIGQMTIRTNLYQDVKPENLKKGMILSSLCSLQMQNSKIKGLPGISTEDLSSRLNENEIESIKRWTQAARIESLVIVRKIPFAIFLALGFWSYYAMGSQGI